MTIMYNAIEILDAITLGVEATFRDGDLVSAKRVPNYPPGQTPPGLEQESIEIRGFEPDVAGPIVYLLSEEQHLGKGFKWAPAKKSEMTTGAAQGSRAPSPARAPQPTENSPPLEADEDIRTREGDRPGVGSFPAPQSLLSGQGEPEQVEMPPLNLNACMLDFNSSILNMDTGLRRLGVSNERQATALERIANMLEVEQLRTEAIKMHEYTIGLETDGNVTESARANALADLLSNAAHDRVAALMGNSND